MLSTGQGVLGHNTFAYCLGNPGSMVDTLGYRPDFLVNLTDCTDGGGGEATIYADGEAISISVTSASIVICAYVNICGPLDADTIIAGIEEYWSGSFEVFGSKKRLKTYVYKGTSKNGKSLVIKTRNKQGVSNVKWRWFNLLWSPQDNGRMTLFKGDSRTKIDYTEQQLKWVAAHEFGHLMGVKDYYAKYPNSTKDSIFNKFGDTVTGNDIEKVLYSFITESIGDW
jgi:hypothetical protein